MKRIIKYFLILLFVSWLWIILYQNPGSVLITYHGWNLETSLWFAIIFLLVLFLFFYISVRFSIRIKAVAVFIKQWLSNRRKRDARSQTILGLYNLIEGNWGVAEKKLSQAAKYSDMQLINYLAAAFVAQYQNALDRRDNYLLLAQQSSVDYPVIVELTQARLQIFNQQWEEALATLQYLRQERPKNVFIMQLLKQVYLKLKDWYGLKLLIPILRKFRVFSEEEIKKLEFEVCRELLLTSVKNKSIEVEWDEMPNYLKKHPALVAIYVEYLLVKKKVDKAEDILKTVLHEGLDDLLLELYTKLPSSYPIKKIARAEKWLETNPENVALLLCLGRVCKKQKLWGKARQYLENSLRLAKTQAAYFELGQIMEAQNDLLGALDSYRKGLQI